MEANGYVKLTQALYIFVSPLGRSSNGSANGRRLLGCCTFIVLEVDFQRSDYRALSRQFPFGKSHEWTPLRPRREPWPAAHAKRSCEPLSAPPSREDPPPLGMRRAFDGCPRRRKRHPKRSAGWSQWQDSAGFRPKPPGAPPSPPGI